ncbi:MAG: TIGR04219 family outer membrane beta-barrel protein [Desulfurobacteriaceae bacterium]
MKRFLAVLTSVFALTSTAGAVTISGGAGAWREKPSGWIEYTENKGAGVSAKTNVDVKDDLHIDDETKAFGWFKISDIPFLPDVKVRYTPMKFTGSGIATTTFTFGKLTVPAKSKVSSKVEANQYDVILTYNFPFIKTATANKLNLQWGINVKVIDGYAKVKYSDPTSPGGWKEDSKSATIPVPMAHLEGEVRPVSLFGLSFEGNWVGYSGSQFYDVVGEFRIYPHKNLFVGIGYRYQRLKLDDISDVSSDLKVKGAFAEAGFTF